MPLDNRAMEGGEIVQCSTSNYSRDHLATSKSVTEHSDTNTRRWLASGFNGFGQLGITEGKRKLPQFEEFKPPFAETKLPVVFACSWSYLAVASECSLHLQGFISNVPNTVKILKTAVTIKSLALCDRYCLILQADGKLYKLLSYASAAMEEVKFQTSEVRLLPQKRSIFGERKLMHKSELRIDFVACGNNIMAAIGNSNEVFSGTSQIHQFPKHVRLKQLVCGFEHALLLTTNGDIYSWGNGLRGQLGQEILRVEERPIILEALAGLKICFIASSGWHSAAISAFGDLYTWGYNSNGQLGLRLYKNDTSSIKEPTVYPLPQIIETPNCCCGSATNDKGGDCLPLKVVCGARHTILLMNCGSIFTCGYNAYGQLGLQTTSTSCDSLQYVLKVEPDINSVQIVGGAWCTIIGTQ